MLIGCISNSSNSGGMQSINRDLAECSAFSTASLELCMQASFLWLTQTRNDWKNTGITPHAIRGSGTMNSYGVFRGVMGLEGHIMSNFSFLLGQDDYEQFAIPCVEARKCWIRSNTSSKPETSPSMARRASVPRTRCSI